MINLKVACCPIFPGISPLPHSPLFPEHVLLCQAHLHTLTMVKGNSLVLTYTIYSGAEWKSHHSISSSLLYPVYSLKTNTIFRQTQKVTFLGAGTATVRPVGFGNRIMTEFGNALVILGAHSLNQHFYILDFILCKTLWQWSVLLSCARVISPHSPSPHVSSASDFSFP